MIFNEIPPHLNVLEILVELDELTGTSLCGACQCVNQRLKLTTCKKFCNLKGMMNIEAVVCNEICTGGTEMSVTITCDEENIIFELAIM